MIQVLQPSMDVGEKEREVEYRGTCRNHGE